ncbi:hypothetical protein [Flammeovirga sp. SJP92]|uniref:hypothetical protein n=1 Tax=Flammeovirga sp. SJP92 TaxID=1775430 RepID=UPI00078828A3|nr:hypothetical protein [Flammeovirga sp. SJP92]KXX67599.1 hypothetical protein AVL50_26425 [Flammeovirga sp. SJP92]
MKMTKVALIVPIFDKTPVYFDLFLNQLSYQRNIDILILSNLKLEKYQFLPHIETKIIDKPQNLERYISENLEWFTSTRTYWGVGSSNFLYGNLYKFIHQLTKNKPTQLTLSGINNNMTFYRSLPTENEDKIALENTELELTTDNIISFNQGRIFNYFNRRSFAFVNIDKAIRNNLFSIPKWEETPNKFYLSNSGFYNEKEFRNYNRLHFQQKIKNKGMRYFISIRHFLKKQVDDVEVISQENHHV